MSGIWSLAELNQLIDALKAQLKNDPAGILGSVTVGGRTVSYRTADDLIKLIKFYAREKARLERVAAGGPRTGYAVAKFP